MKIKKKKNWAERRLSAGKAFEKRSGIGVNQPYVADKPKKVDPNAERLVSVAIIRDGTVHNLGARSHYELRYQLGDENPIDPKFGDQSGFFTSKDRFVNRADAMEIALNAGQIPSRQSRELLSSDVRW